MERLLRDLSNELDTLESSHLRRRLTRVTAVREAVVEVDGRELVCWCSNDYLGFASHPALAAAAAAAARQWGVGSRASRLLAGTTEVHAQLEQSLAAWCGAESAIVYPSGYLANLGALGALLSPQDAVFVDRLAHASLLDAARATRATFRVFRHNDAPHLAELLARAGQARRRIIVTEGLFSMDGDRAPLAELLEIADRHDAVLYLDDAHGMFVEGATGRGSAEAAGVASDRLIVMGALGKALGCQGGFLAGARALIDALHNHSRTFIYTTALAVPVAAAAIEALRLLETEPQWRRQLGARIAALQTALPQAHVGSHIVPIIVGDTAEALRRSQRLWEQGIWAPAIRPPTVPDGTARLRLSVTARHTDEQILALARALAS